MPYFLVYYIVNTISTWAFGVFLIKNDDPIQHKQDRRIEWKKLLPMPLVGFIVAIVWLLTGWKLPMFASQYIRDAKKATEAMKWEARY